MHVKAIPNQIHHSKDFSLLGHTQSNTELMCYEAKEIELSHTLSSSSCKIKSLVTISLLCVMISHCIPIDSPSRKELSNFNLFERRTTTTAKVIANFHRYVNITCVQHFFCVLQMVLVSLVAYLGFIQHTTQNNHTP